MSRQSHPSLFQEVPVTPKPLPTAKELDLLRADFLKAPKYEDGRPNVFGLDNKVLKGASNTLANDNSIVLSHVEKSTLTLAFFSKQNVENLQVLIKNAVKLETGLVIDEQSNNELLLVLKYIFITYSNPPPPFTIRLSQQEKTQLSKIYTAEIDRLNNLVVKYIVPRVVSELESHILYLRDASAPISIIEQPENVSAKGTRNYRSQFDVLTGQDF